MQEGEQTVSFSPNYEGYQPWFVRLYALYLFIILLIMLFRFARFIWQRRKLRRANAEERPVFSPVSISSKDLAKLTLLVTSLDLSWWLTDIFGSVQTAKSTSLAYVLPEIGDALVPTTLGLLFTLMLYVGSLVASALQNRRK